MVVRRSPFASRNDSKLPLPPENSDPDASIRQHRVKIRGPVRGRSVRWRGLAIGRALGQPATLVLGPTPRVTARPLPRPDLRAEGGLQQSNAATQRRPAGERGAVAGEHEDAQPIRIRTGFSDPAPACLALD